ncbi:MAG: IS200/IS605 family transposase [Gallionellaceae bacterium]|nr:IS200/IS605 family transposase [Gallionellaceae bacterium]
MPSTHTSLHYHLIFATKNREPRLAPEWRGQLHEYLGGTVRGLDGHAQGIGGVDDHVHLLVSLKATHCLADFMRELKKAASSWIRATHRQPDFHWQEGYAAFSVSASALDTVRAYIARQEAHHQKEPFRNELLAFLQKSGVEFDARYLD